MKTLMTHLSRLPRPHFGSAALSVLALAFLYLTMRNMGIYPSIFGDEWTYASATRLEPWREALIPNYLYYSVYALSNQCGSGFMECARSLNVLFFLGAAPFIYLIARQFASRPVAACTALLAVLRPANSYTAYFMPEAMYYAGFWLLTWSAFRFARRPGWNTLLTSAALLGLLALVKVHALFLIPGWSVLVAYAAWNAPRAAGARHWLPQALLWIGAGLALALTLRLALGYLYGGSGGLHLLGRMYAGQAQGKPALLAILPAALQNLKGHVAALVLMLPLPCAAVLAACCGLHRRAQAPQREVQLLAAYTVVMLGALLAITVLFTASVAGFGAESSARLHMRYYDFLLPLLLLLAAAQTAPALAPAPLPLRAVVAVLAAGAVVYGARHLLPAFAPNHIDSPELFGLLYAPSLTWLAALGLASTLAWIVAPRRGALLFLFVYAPLFTLLAGWQLNTRVREQQQSDPYVRAGLFAREYLSRAEQDRLMLVGRDAGDLFKVRMMIDNPKVQLLVQPHGSRVEAAQLGGPGSFALVVGKYQLPAEAEAYLRPRDFALVRVPLPAAERRVVRFAQPEYEWGMAAVQGLSGPEPWGRWSDQDQVVLEFAEALPPSFTLRLDAAAFGPNAGQEFVVRLGGQERRVRIPAEQTRIALAFEATPAQRTLTITVPQAVSPLALAQGSDARRLGIALYRMDIIAR